MRVLELGRPQAGYSVEVRCTGRGNGKGGCGALLLVEEADMRYYPGVPGDTWGSRDPEVAFRCCECGIETNLERQQWPPRPTKLKKWSKGWAEAELGSEEADDA